MSSTCKMTAFLPQKEKIYTFCVIFYLVKALSIKSLTINLKKPINENHPLYTTILYAYHLYAQLLLVTG